MPQSGNSPKLFDAIEVLVSFAEDDDREAWGEEQQQAAQAIIEMTREFDQPPNGKFFSLQTDKIGSFFSGSTPSHGNITMQDRDKTVTRIRGVDPDLYAVAVGHWRVIRREDSVSWRHMWDSMGSRGMRGPTTCFLHFGQNVPTTMTHAVRTTYNVIGWKIALTTQRVIWGSRRDDSVQALLKLTASFTVNMLILVLSDVWESICDFFKWLIGKQE